MEVRVLLRSAALLLLLGVCQDVMPYETIVMTNDLWNSCGSRIDYDYAGMFKAYPEDYYTPDVWDCQVSVIVGVNHLVHLRFESFDLYSPLADCSDHYLKIYDGYYYEGTSTPLLTGPYGICTNIENPTDVPAPIITTGDVITLYYYRNMTVRPADFRISYATVVSFEDDNECFMCVDNSTGGCLSHKLKCDGTHNCADGSDEDVDGGCSDVAEFVGTILLIIVITSVIIVLIVIGCIVACIVCCCCVAAKSTSRPTTVAQPIPYSSPTVYSTQLGDYPRQPPPIGYQTQSPPAYPAGPGVGYNPQVGAVNVQVEPNKI